MKIIIVGEGKVGKTIIESMLKEKHEIVLIDNNPKVVGNVTDLYDVNGFAPTVRSMKSFSKPVPIKPIYLSP